jgi:hypothetical protein
MPVRDGSGIAVVRTCAGCAEVHKKAIVSRGLLYAAVLAPVGDNNSVLCACVCTLALT